MVPTRCPYTSLVTAMLASLGSLIPLQCRHRRPTSLAEVIFDPPRNSEAHCAHRPSTSGANSGNLARIRRRPGECDRCCTPWLQRWGAGTSEEKLLMAGPGRSSADRRPAWYGPANVNSICAQAGYLWSAVEADGDVHSFDSARASMTTRWTESGRIAASC